MTNEHISVILSIVKSGIYKITNLKNGKFYIGSSNDIDNRWTCHIRDLTNKCHTNPKLQHAWDFYGKDIFKFEIVEEVDPNPELLFERENHYLSTLKPYERKVGYNICPKAEGGDNFTHNPRKEEIRAYWLIHNKGEGNPMFGKNHTEKTIDKQKEKSIGRYTLEWFIERNGEEEGKKKFQERRQMLMNRKINYSYDNKMSGTKRGPMAQEIRDRISERRAKMKLIRDDLRKDILTEKYTITELTAKWGVSKPTILRERRKMI